MNNKLDFKSLMTDSRAQVYLLWAALLGIGYVATHYFQRQQINGLWMLLSVIGLGYMYRVMPLGVSQMKKIYIAWLVPIAFGMAVSGLAFYVDSLAGIVGYLGAFWLGVQAVGFFWNGLVDAPAKWYYIVAAVNFVAGLLCYSLDSLVSVQYLVAAVVSVWSMVALWIYRT